jgi:hypothetical protein
LYYHGAERTLSPPSSVPQGLLLHSHSCRNCSRHFPVDLWRSLLPAALSSELSVPLLQLASVRRLIGTSYRGSMSGSDFSAVDDHMLLLLLLRALMRGRRAHDVQSSCTFEYINRKHFRESEVEGTTGPEPAALCTGFGRFSQARGRSVWSNPEPTALASHAGTALSYLYQQL